MHVLSCVSNQYAYSAYCLVLKRITFENPQWIKMGVDSYKIQNGIKHKNIIIILYSAWIGKKIKLGRKRVKKKKMST